MTYASHKYIAAVAAMLFLCGVGIPCAAQSAEKAGARIILLHHSTGECVWNGGVPAWFSAYNAANGTNYTIVEQNFPKESPYGWENYPYDYWNIWVAHAGARPFKEEPTLEMLTSKYDVIVFKHCFPVSNIEADTGQGDVASSEKRVENYKLQYAALKEKMRKFPATKFIVWTGAAQVRGEIDAAAAGRAKAFFNWVRSEWDEKGDNIYVWDFYELETEGGLYLKGEHAAGASDSHPNEKFCKTVAPYLCQRIVDVISGKGDTGSVTGQGGKPLKVPAAAPPAAEAEKQPPVEEQASVEKRPAPAAGAIPAGGGKWVFDDAENEAVAKQLWGPAGRYVAEDGNHVVKITFAEGREEDWGEYGMQRVVRTGPPAKNHDVTPYNYIAIRVKADRQMEVVLSLMTLPDPRGSVDQSHFQFSAYLRCESGDWKWLVFDLSKLELAAEGETAYEAAGRPARPMSLTGLRLCTNKKNENAAFAIDDIMFLRDLPKDLKPFLQTP